MWIEEKYSDEVQQRIDELNNAIASIYEDIQIKASSSFYLTYEQSKQLRHEYMERIKPYQAAIRDIILYSPKQMIIHNVNVKEFCEKLNNIVEESKNP